MAKAKKQATEEPKTDAGAVEAEVAEPNPQEEDRPRDDSLPTGTRRHLPPE